MQKAIRKMRMRNNWNKKCDEDYDERRENCEKDNEINYAI